MNRKNFVITFSIISSAVILLSLAVISFVFKQDVLIALLISISFIAVLLIIFYSLETIENENNKQIQSSLDTSTRNALGLGNIGILVYSDEYEVTWMSSFFEARNLDYLGDKLLNWLPELQSVLSGDDDKKIIIFNDEKYEVNKISDASALLFKDITIEYDLDKKLNEDACVLGMVSFDNYEEFSSSEDELAFINLNIKRPVMDYFKKFNCVYKTLKNNRLILILNEAIYKQIHSDSFSILSKVRKISSGASLDVTLSMAFVRGGDSLSELDTVLESLMELAQTRGGDQVVVRKIGDDVSFFGGLSEARDKSNKSKVRVTISSIKDLISKSSNVMIVGHKDADADCIGSAICMSNIVTSLGKNAYIVIKNNGIEPKIKEILDNYDKALSKKHIFIDENNAVNMLNESSLVIMVDHHGKDTSACKLLLDKANKIVIIDHHRRKADLDISPLLVYIEASASSTCEMVCEFLPYMSKNLELSEQEANIMYVGVMIDTDKFRVRTGSRTFDVLKQLRKYGANPLVCDELTQESYNMVINRSNIISNAKTYSNGIVISSCVNSIYSRSIASQACDVLIRSKEIEAAFVICNTEKDEVIVTARSKGKVNVQVILEKMHGGGHMMAAGLQRSDTSVEKVEEELVGVLDEYKEMVNKEQ